MDFTADSFQRRLEEKLDTEPASTGEAKSPTVDLSKLLQLSGDGEFVREAYRRMLGRECDPGGYSNYTQLLRGGMPRAAMLRQLADSDEGKSTGLRYTGLADWRGSSPAAPSAGWAQRTNTWVLETIQRVLARLRGAFRITGLELKLDYLAAEIAAASERQSSKGDLLSAKIDFVGARTEFVATKLEVVAGHEERLAERLDGLEAKGELEAADTASGLAELRAATARISAETAQLINDTARLAEESRQGRAAADASWREERREIDRLRVRLEGLESAVAKVAGAQRAAVFQAGKNVIVTEVDGFILGVPGEEWRLGAYYALRGLPEPGTVKLFQELVKPGMVVADVGAHIGVFTLYALRAMNGQGKIFSFEPSPQTMKLLRDNVQVNGFLELGVVRFLPLAAAGESGEADLTVYGENSGHNTLFGTGTGGEMVRVQTMTLDEALAEEPRLDIVKIDAEGAEPGILRGMNNLLARNPGMHILLEFAPEHLQRAGVDPLQWGSDLVTSGFLIRRVEDVTGELLPVVPEELARCVSWNLLLTQTGSQISST